MSFSREQRVLFESRASSITPASIIPLLSESLNLVNMPPLLLQNR